MNDSTPIFPNLREVEWKDGKGSPRTQRELSTGRDAAQHPKGSGCA